MSSILFKVDIQPAALGDDCILVQLGAHSQLATGGLLRAGPHAVGNWCGRGRDHQHQHQHDGDSGSSNDASERDTMDMVGFRLVFLCMDHGTRE